MAHQRPRAARLTSLLRLSLPLAILAALITTPANATPDMASITRPAIAAATCPQEWSAIIASDPTKWDDTNPIDIDPSLNPATTDAFNKYVVAIMATAEYISHFVMLMDGQNPLPTDIATAEPVFDLAVCLIPTSAERDLILDVAVTVSDGSADEINKAVFNAFDQFDCMGIRTASTAIFSLDPDSATFSGDVTNLIKQNVRACP